MYRLITLLAATLLLLSTSACNHNDSLKKETATTPAGHDSAHVATAHHDDAVTAAAPAEQVTAPATEQQPQQEVAPEATDVTYTTNILFVGLANKYGTVIVPHSTHVQLFSCDTCHTTMPPGKIVKTKREFHNLCRKCHKEMKAGPTKCRACHMRK